MTPRNVTENPVEYYAWLQWAMSPDPQPGPGPMAERSEQTIDERTTTNIGPEHRSDFGPSEDDIIFVSKQPVKSVRLGRAAS